MTSSSARRSCSSGSNHERLHSGLGYMVPWHPLVTDVTVPSERVEEILGALPPP